jgi:hypothetical protein
MLTDAGMFNGSSTDLSGLCFDLGFDMIRTLSTEPCEVESRAAWPNRVRFSWPSAGDQARVSAALSGILPSRMRLGAAQVDEDGVTADASVVLLVADGGLAELERLQSLHIGNLLWGRSSEALARPSGTPGRLLPGCTSDLPFRGSIRRWPTGLPADRTYSTGRADSGSPRYTGVFRG